MHVIVDPKNWYKKETLAWKYGTEWSGNHMQSSAAQLLRTFPIVITVVALNHAVASRASFVGVDKDCFCMNEDIGNRNQR